MEDLNKQLLMSVGVFALVTIMIILSILLLIYLGHLQLSAWALIIMNFAIIFTQSALKVVRAYTDKIKYAKKINIKTKKN